MNPLTNVKNITKLNETELDKGYKKSWHDMYSNSAWIFIGGLPYGLTEGDILAVFSQYGEIININLVRDKKTGKTKGYSFLCYANQKSTILAVDNLNGIKLCNRTIRVDHVANYKPPKENEADDDITKMLKSEGCAPKVMQACEKEQESKSEKKKKKKLKKEKKESKKKKKRKDRVEEPTEMKVKKEKQDPGYDKNDLSNIKRTSESRSRERNREGESSNFRYDDYRTDIEKHSKNKLKRKERSRSKDAAGYQDRVKDSRRSEQHKQYSSSSDDNSSSSSSSDEERSNIRQNRHHLKDQKSSDERSKYKKSKYED